MNVITRWRISRHPAPVRDDYMTRAEHQAEAERLAWVIDDAIQSGAKRTLGDLIALARLHLDLADHPGQFQVQVQPVRSPAGQ